MKPLTEENTSKFVQAGPVRVHYNEAGDGQALIFCEGQGPGTSAWVVYHSVFGALSEHFRCLLLDQPGYGKSDPIVVADEARSDMYARAVRDFMDALNIEKATIVDMSFGAQTAQVFAIQFPERVNKLVMHASGLSGPGFFAIEPTEGITVMAETFRDPTMESMRRMMNCFLYDGERYSDEELMLRQRLKSWLDRPELDAARRQSRRGQRNVSIEEIGSIAAPVLQIHGRDDRIAPFERAIRLLNALPDSRLMIFKNCGHWIPVERPAEFSNLVIGFVLDTARPM